MPVRLRRGAHFLRPFLPAAFADPPDDFEEDFRAPLPRFGLDGVAARDAALAALEIRPTAPAVGLTRPPAPAAVSRAAFVRLAACSPACPTSRAALSMTSPTTLRAVSSAPPPCLSFFAIRPPLA